MTRILKQKSNKNVTRARKQSKPCILCSKTCGCNVANYHEQNVNMTAELFVKDKALCKTHDNFLDSEYNEQKKKHKDLQSSREFYKSMYYSELLRSAKFDAQFCDHVDQKLLYKRLENIHEDFDKAVYLMENKEGK